MRNSKLDSKVLIVGGGPVGLFTALQLCQLDVPIRIIDESPKNDQLSTQLNPTSTPTLLSPSSSCRSYDCLGTILLLSPRVLQLLQSLGLFDDVIAHGVKHWQLQIHSSTYSPAAPAPFTAVAPSTTSIDANNLPPDAVYSYKLWENKATNHNFCLSIEHSTLCQLLETALAKRYNIQVDYDCKLVDLQYGGDLGNTIFMENELDSDFYLGAGRMDPIMTAAAATGVNSSIQPIIATIHYQKQQPTYQQDSIQVCQTQYMVEATGKPSTVRQKLEDKLQAKQHDRHWQQQMQRKLSAKSTTSYKKTLGDNDDDDCRPYCYSLVTKMKTNCPELKPISIVAKPEGTLIFLVHNNYASIMIQQKKDPAKEPLSLMKMQKLIQKLLQPYDIEFLDTCNYYYWKDSTSSSPGSDTPNMDNRLFFLGDASHDTRPPGWLSPDLGFEQAINLCWKLNLHLQHRSTPHLLDTYYSETRIKNKDASMATNILLRLLDDPTTIMKGGGMANLLQEHRHCFIGGLLLENNILNLKCPQTRKVQRGSVGTLAPNASLKPYHLSQLLTQQNSHQHTKSPSLSPKPLSTNGSKTRRKYSSDDDTSGQQEDQTSTNKLKFLRGLFTFPGSKKSQALTSSSPITSISPTSTTTTSDKWKGIRANHYHLWDQLSSHTGFSSSRSTFTVLVLCGSLLDYNSIVALRKLKKHLDQSTSFLRSFEYPHHQYPYQQQQQPQQPLSQSKSTPIQGVRSNASVSNNTTTSFSPVTPMPSSSSSKTQPQPRRSESSSSFYSVKSSISSTDESISSDSQHQVHRDSYGTSLKSPRSSIFTRFSTTSSTDRYSMATTISNGSIMSSSNSPPPPVPPLPLFSPSSENKLDNMPTKKHHSNNIQLYTPTQGSSSSPLFSFLCLTTSSKQESIRFLSEQTPYSLHQLFPFGLSRTFLDHDQQAHQLYAVKENKPTIVIIRPDGYVGAQIVIDDLHLHELDRYFDQILLPVVDFSSAASLVADDYCL